MAAPVITETYPNNNDTGIPIGIIAKVWFDKLIDLKSAKEAIHLYGPDFDYTSGPDTAAWIDQDTGNNPFFLSSPGFNGNAPLKYELFYYDLTTGDIVIPAAITDSSVGVSENVGTVVYLNLDTKYLNSLAADTTYTLNIIGDDINKTGIASRTIFDVVPDAGNTGNGELYTYGIWSGIGTDSVIIEITTAGDIGTAKYKWKFGSETLSEYRLNKVVSRKFRTLEDGIQVRFDGSNFQVGDIFVFNLENAEYIDASTQITFTTNDGSYAEPPDTISTPATSTPASTVLPWLSSSFQVEKSMPVSGSYNVDYKKRQMIIYFTEDIDDTTITADSLQLWSYPVSGHYKDTHEPYQLKYEYTVVDNILTIKF